MTKRLILAAAFSALFVSPALAETCEDQLVLVDDLMATEGSTLDAEVKNEIIALRNSAKTDLTYGDEAECLEKAEEALSLFSQ